MAPRPLHLAVALDGAGWHPQAWREPSSRPTELFTSKYWADLARLAERGLLDFLTIEDAFGLQSTSWTRVDDRTDHVRGRLEAVMIASMVAPLTTHIGLIPSASTTHSEPFHIASATSTLDWVSKGRGGWRPQVSSRAHEARHVGLRELPTISPRRFAPGNPIDPDVAAVIADLFDEAADVVEVVRRLWDSWEDDAIIRDVTTGRFVDREKLHYIDFTGRFFSVKGPSIVPRPPQGQPVVAALAHQTRPIEFAAVSADVVFVTPLAGLSDDDDVRAWVDHVNDAERAVGRSHDGRLEPIRVFADVTVFLDTQPGDAAARLARLDALDGSALASDAHVFTGTPLELADLLLEWQGAGLHGFRLRPGVLEHDLRLIVDELVPLLQQRHVFRTEYAERDLRTRLGLPRLPSRYAAAS